MDIEKAREILEETDTEFYGEGLVDGVNIIGKYVKEKWAYSFQHDQMWFGDFESTVEQMTEEEVTMLAKLGWSEDEDGWSLSS